MRVRATSVCSALLWLLATGCRDDDADGGTGDDAEVEPPPGGLRRRDDAGKREAGPLQFDVHAHEGLALDRETIDRFELRAADDAPFAPECLAVAFDGEPVLCTRQFEQPIGSSWLVQAAASDCTSCFARDTDTDLTLTHGPFVGERDAATGRARVWIRTDASRTVQLHLSTSADMAGAQLAASVVPEAGDDFTAELLSPGRGVLAAHAATARRDGGGGYVAPDPAEDPLGAEQTDWLVEGLMSSTATFKFIAAGTRFYDGSGPKAWGPFEEARDALLTRIADEGIEGVILLAGGPHVSEYRQFSVAGRTWHELGASPISSGLGECSGAAGQIECYDAVKNSLRIDVDTTLADPTVTARIVTFEGEKDWSTTTPVVVIPRSVL